jgi:hypothetical protein
MQHSLCLLHLPSDGHIGLSSPSLVSIFRALVHMESFF